MSLSLIRKFKDDRSGAVAIIFTLLLTSLVTLVGGTVDYIRWSQANGKTIQAMDAAVLAGGRMLLLGKTEAEAVQAAQDFYAENKSNDLHLDAVTFTVEGTGTKVVAVSNSSVKTAFLQIAGIPELRIRETTHALVEVGANGGQDVEIALMLDTTGSMRGNKMTALKEAATDLVNIVVWDDQTEFTSRVAVVPFSYYVNLGRDAFQSATNVAPSGSGVRRTCVKERPGSKRYTDATPNSGNGYFDRYTGTGTCKPRTTLLPLTSNKTDLHNRIDAMETTGMTAGHLGTQWTWYALSPNFAGLWPADSQPKSYSLLTELNEDNRPKLQKIAILMTDGEYNQKYSGDSSAIQARAQCAAMKATGITVYTVGFAISAGGEADTTMAQCATASDYYYSADDSDALRRAFRDIALKIATLRLTQ